MSDELTGFVREALQQGKTKAEIRAILLEAGWAGDAVDKAIAAYADVEFPVPVPRPRPYLSAREAFFYLVMFSTLYASALSFGAILFEIIEYLIPDPAERSLPTLAISSIRWAASWLLISFPVYLWLARHAHLALRDDPEKRTSKVRKWLTYLTLFLAAIVIIGDLVTLVFNLLSGELTLRFISKVVVVGAIAGTVFGHYSRDLREDDLHPDDLPSRRKGLQLLTGIVSACVLAALVGGLMLAGSPKRARAERLDRQRADDLQAIASAMDSYWERHETLPRNLDTLAEERGLRVRSIRDPQTDELYSYTILTDSTYELCATFSEESADPETRPAGNRFWQHEAGRTCFEIEVR